MPSARAESEEVRSTSCTQSRQRASRHGRRTRRCPAFFAVPTRITGQRLPIQRSFPPHVHRSHRAAAGFHRGRDPDAQGRHRTEPARKAITPRGLAHSLRTLGEVPKISGAWQARGGGAYLGEAGGGAARAARGCRAAGGGRSRNATPATARERVRDGKTRGSGGLGSASSLPCRQLGDAREASSTRWKVSRERYAKTDGATDARIVGLPKPPS